jgi:LacI family transcriptional regulator
MLSQRKIAEILGMSTSTVANILNGTPNYKKETRERVLKAAAELGYQRNRASLTIKRGRSNLIGIIHFGLSYEATHQAAFHLAKAVNDQSYDYLVVDLKWHEGNVERALDEIIQTRAEGAILLGNTAETFMPQHLAMLERARIPVVSLYGEDDLNIPLVSDDSQSSFFSMARHLQEVGHCSILHPTIGTFEFSTCGRVTGLQMAMEGKGPCHIFSEEEFTRVWPRLRREHQNEPMGIIVKTDVERYGRDITKAYHELSTRLFASGALPDAIMCSNDLAACGVINAAYEMKVRVPEDIAVTGADNDRVGEFPMFRLTTIRMDIEQSSKTAVEMLITRLKGGSPDARIRSFPSQLVLRQSCGRMAGPGEDMVRYVPTQPAVFLAGSNGGKQKIPVQKKVRNTAKPGSSL